MVTSAHAYCYEVITQGHRKMRNSEIPSTDSTKKLFHLGLPLLPGDRLTSFALSLSICQGGCAQRPCSVPTPYASSAGAAHFPGCWPWQTWRVSEHIHHTLRPVVQMSINSAGWEGLPWAAEELGFAEKTKYHNPTPSTLGDSTSLLELCFKCTKPQRQ